MDKLLTIKDVAEYLQMSKEKVYKLAQRGKIPVSRIENQWRFRLEKVEAWLEANEIGSIGVTAPQVATLHIPSHAEPFLKWAGGKGQLLKQYEAFFPSNFNNFFEPFIGGGAVFFYLFNAGRLQDRKKIFLIDSNEELINCYSVIKQDVEKLIKILNSPKFINTEETFYKIRAEESKDKFERAARTIYLNKTCFNGLYRVNSKGKFNVPFGGYKNPLICNSRNLIAVSLALQNVEILYGDFDRCLKLAKKEDFIYFDPPYQPLNKTSSFTSYTKEPFGEKEQVKLSKVFRELDKIGCKIMLSNSDTPFIRITYKRYRIEKSLSKEIFILNY